MNKYKNAIKKVDKEIDFSKILNIFKRNKLYISIVSFAFSGTVLIYTYTIKPVYRGTFQIIVRSNKESSLLGTLKSSLLSGQTSLSNSIDPRTQELILTSPSVLKPVYEKVKQNFQKRGIDVSKLLYADWAKNYLNIYYEQGSNVLTIKYKDTDKDQILNVLNKISEKYKSYSLKEREQLLSKEIYFLEKQEIEYDEISRNSLKALNKFSVENNLGNIDGFISSNNPLSLDSKNSLKEVESLLNKKNNFDKNVDSAAQRFKNQFALLERYETQFTDLSSRFKPKSYKLRALKIKIENLRESLKRPNEILIKYNDLKRKALRDQNTLENIQLSLVEAKLEKVKSKFPWDIISEPTIEKKRVSPKRKESALMALILSFIGAYFVALYREKRSGIIYEFEDLRYEIPFDFLDDLPTYNINFSTNIIKKYLQVKSNDFSNCGIVIAKSMQNYINYFDNLKLKNLRVFTLDNLDQLDLPENIEKLILIVENEKFNKSDLKILNNYCRLFDNKFVGWFFLEENSK